MNPGDLTRAVIDPADQKLDNGLILSNTSLHR